MLAIPKASGNLGTAQALETPKSTGTIGIGECYGDTMLHKDKHGIKRQELTYAGSIAIWPIVNQYFGISYKCNC